MNVCQAGHKEHKQLTSEVHAGDMDFELYIYDAPQYFGFKGYCTGQDDISRTLINTGTWEPEETSVVMQVLKNATPGGLVLDFGTHIGWYSIIAAKLGFKVRGFEGDPENAALLRQNAIKNSVEDKIDVAVQWVDKSMAILESNEPVELLKVDIEGNESGAIRACRELFQKGKIKNALIEISPCFNDSYPALIDFILSWGYKAYFAKGKLGELEQFDYAKFINKGYDFEQTNLLFVKE